MKVSIIGFGFWIVAAALFIFKGVSKVVPSTDIHIFTIEELVGLDWIGSIPWERVQDWANVIAVTNLSILLLIIGGIFLVISMFLKV